MKLSFLRAQALSLLASFLFAGAAAAQICIDPLPGLVSWWNAESNALDIFGSNSGAISNGVAFGAGKVNQAFQFDGVNDYVRIPFSSNLFTSNFTFQAWVKPSAQPSDPSGQDLIFGQALGPQLVALPGTTGAKVVFAFRTNASVLPASFTRLTNSTELPLNQFSHLAATWDGTTMRLYVNGAQTAQNVPGRSPVLSSSNYFIGGLSEGPTLVGQFFNGLLDEVQVFNRALSAAEILSVSSAGTAGMCLPGTHCLEPPAGLISWWAGDGAGWDRIGNNGATLRNGVTFAGGMVREGFNFDGISAALQIPYSPTLVTSNLTVELWVNPAAQVQDPLGEDLLFGQAFAGPQLLLKPGVTGVRVSWQARIHNGDLREALSQQEIPLHSFSHLVGTWDGTNLLLYINGVLDAQQTLAERPLPSTCDFFIGGFVGACGFTGEFFQGVIDEISLYNRPLSATEAAALFRTGATGKCISRSIVVYDNTATSLNQRYESTAEFGDEIVLLEGTSRVLTNFSFEYFGTNFSGNEQVRVRLYKNDGAQVSAGAFAPHSVLYDSGFINVIQTLGTTLTFSGLNVIVPDDFTWAVLFTGIATNEEAGLKLYSPPSVGRNYTDYWETVGANWQLLVRNDSTPMDFGARFEAVRPAERFRILSLELLPASPGLKVVVKWERQEPFFFSLETSTNLTAWSTLASNLTSSFTWTNPVAGPMRFFRVRTP